MNTPHGRRFVYASRLRQWPSLQADPSVALGGVHASFACERCHTSGLDKPGRLFACSACHPGGTFTSAYCSCHSGSPPSGGG